MPWGKHCSVLTKVEQPKAIFILILKYISYIQQQNTCTEQSLLSSKEVAMHCLDLSEMLPSKRQQPEICYTGPQFQYFTEQIDLQGGTSSIDCRANRNKLFSFRTGRDTSQLYQPQLLFVVRQLPGTSKGQSSATRPIQCQQLAHELSEHNFKNQNCHSGASSYLLLSTYLPRPLKQPQLVNVSNQVVCCFLRLICLQSISMIF